jgi:hypothetical protein
LTKPNIDDIIRYEDGGMTEAEVIEFFQNLVDTGLAWKLQGSYGRTAKELINYGWVKTPAEEIFGNDERIDY